MLAMKAVLMVLTHLPDEASAQCLMKKILAERLAACVSCLSPSESHYYWNNAVEVAREWPLMIKTMPECYPALEACILQNHPYDLPEILVFNAHTTQGYGQWIAQETLVQKS